MDRLSTLSGTGRGTCVAGGVFFAALITGVALIGGGSPAQAQGGGTSVLGIPCVPGEGGTRICQGSLVARVPSWDGLPLDVDLYLPPDDGEPDPLIVALHGFAATKLGAFTGSDYPFQKAQEGYAVMAYSARGQGFSCGVPVSRTPGDCDEGWIHLADARYEGRDTQHLAGLLVDDGLVQPKRIGVTGDSYGGGQSLMLATLRDRMILPDGSFAPFESPDGVPMEIAAAAPRIGWSDLAYALAPTGRKLDYRAANPYGKRPGITKYSYLEGLYTAGQPGFYAPQGADPSADITTWKNALDAGPPYDKKLFRRIFRELRRYRSALSVQDVLPPSKRKAPAPTVIYEGFTDDIMPPDQALHYYEKVRSEFPGHEPSLVFGAEYGHNRGSLAANPTIHDAARDALFARELMGDSEAEVLDGVVTETLGCSGAPALGPFETATWRDQHPGEIRVRGREKQITTSAGGSDQNSLQTDPFGGITSCPTVAAATDPGAATYLGKPAEGEGYTLIGSPTVTA
ncbi:MAG: CocE/NonD family hydrolase, partial [Solirubrobacterales bacterium]